MTDAVPSGRICGLIGQIVQNGREQFESGARFISQFARRTDCDRFATVAYFFCIRSSRPRVSAINDNIFSPPQFVLSYSCDRLWRPDAATQNHFYANGCCVPSIIVKCNVTKSRTQLFALEILMMLKHDITTL